MYHAGRTKEALKRTQQNWSGGDLDAVVATVAFGMGIDKPDVRWVAHWGPPSSLEGLYQESGRAGRDGKPSRLGRLTPHSSSFVRSTYEESLN